MRTSDAYLTPERVDRQRGVVDQALLDGLCVGVSGSGTLADLVDVCLTGLGVGVIARDDSRGGLLDRLGVSLENRYQERVSGSLDSVDVLVDCAHSYEGFCGPRITFCEDGLDGIGGSFSDRLCGVLAGLAGQRVVRYAQGLEPLPSTTVSVGEQRAGGRALVVGGGGTGTYASLFGALAGYAVDVMDPDRIEASNLNRQVLYSGLVGEGKASSLVSRLDRLGNQGAFFDRSFDESCAGMVSEYAVVFSCVDRLSPRRLLSRACEDAGVSLVDGGVGPWSGRVMGCYAGRTHTLGEQVCLEGEDPDPVACVEAEPSIIMPNMIVGSLMVEHAVMQPERSWHYDGHAGLVYERGVLS